jgi:hypothetical protein
MNDAGDMRVPVLAGEVAPPGASDIVVAASFAAPLGHAAGCACHRPRAPLANDLGRLFLARARGEVAFFSRVIVPCPPGDEAALAAALTADPVTAARFRFAGRLTP